MGMLGSFTQMFLVSGFSLWLSESSEGKYAFRMGTMGAFTCMNYALNAAPAAQPKSALMGTVITVLVCLILKAIPNFEPVWIRMAFSVAASITAMSLAGVPHPPAAGTAVFFSTTEKADWDELAL